MLPILLSSCLSFATVLAHMQLNYPPTFGSANNPHRTDPVDQRLTFPYNCCGRNTTYPCRGYLNQVGTSQGASVATWPAGSVQNFSLSDGNSPYGGNHYGGSCQVGFSIDNGTTFHVATSYEGNCPHRHGGVDPKNQTFDFTVPVNMPFGDAIFAWTWFNREQEFNMNCAAITIVSPRSSTNPANTSSISNSSSSSMVSSSFSSGSLISSTFLTSLVKTVPLATSPPSATSIPQPTSNPKATSIPEATSIPPSPPTPFSPSPPSPPFSSPNSILPFSPTATFTPSLYPNTTFENPPDVIGSYPRQAFPPDGGSSFTPFLARPTMFVADIGNGCETQKTLVELKFPEPGPDVVLGDGAYPLGWPLCGV